MKALKGRLIAIWYILKSRNFILLHGCQDWERDGEKGTTVGVLRRTDFSDRKDLYVMCHSITSAFENIQLTIPDSVEDKFFDKNGRHKRE